MNTLTNTRPFVAGMAKDNVILLEELEFNMPIEQLNYITELHNDGMSYEDISKEVKRNKYEVLLALIHQAKKGKPLRPLAFRK